jgi:hypothetical protein
MYYNCLEGLIKYVFLVHWSLRFKIMHERSLESNYAIHITHYLRIPEA